MDIHGTEVIVFETRIKHNTVLVKNVFDERSQKSDLI